MIATNKLLSAAAWALAALMASPTAAVAQYPDRPITITVGFAPGGTSDVAARILAERMTRSLGTAVIGLFVACLLAGAARRHWRKGRSDASTQWEPT